MMQIWHRSAKSESETAARDWRGRRKIEDLEQWAYTPSVNERVPALLNNARTADDAQAKVALDDASHLIDDASRRAREIANYWLTPSIAWPIPTPATMLNAVTPSVAQPWRPSAAVAITASESSERRALSRCRPCAINGSPFSATFTEIVEQARSQTACRA